MEMDSVWKRSKCKNHKDVTILKTDKLKRGLNFTLHLLIQGVYLQPYYDRLKTREQ